MAKQILTRWTGVAVILTAGAVLALASFYPARTAENSPCLASSALPDPSNPNLDCPAPPNTFDVTGFFGANALPEDRLQAGPTWDAWAWASFAALNWPAKVDTTQPTGFQRGVPDTTRSFKDALGTDVAVWETFKEKREVFNATIDSASLWQHITFDPDQQPESDSNPDGIKMCPSAPGSVDLSHFRFFSAGAKLSPSLGGDNTFDETVEVASPAQEKAEDLCAGYTSSTNPTLDFCMNTIFPDNLFTPTTNGRTPVGPRVWKGDPGTDPTATPVFFEVKVNYDFWNYMLDNRFYDDSTAYAAARSQNVGLHPKLPFRTSAPKGPGRSINAAFNYNADSVRSMYPHLQDLNTLPKVGSVHIKAGWLLLGPNDTPSDYHTTNGVFYQTINEPTYPDSLCYNVAQFGLIGLHIIQRVHALQSNEQYTEFAHGGTFIFATWEHTSIGDSRNSSAYYYANFLAKDTLINTNQPTGFDIETTPFPNVSLGQSGINVVRMQDYPLPSTQAVNAAVHDSLPETSVWQNYRLIGTQFVAVNDSATSAMFNQPHFLANLVVETNTGLQHFEGLPPGVSVTPYYTQNVTIKSTANPPLMFESTFPNVIFNRQQQLPVNMGGCMGCHGVAQLNGYNFSFVFQNGQRGSGLDTQIHFEVAGGAGPSPSNDQE